MEPKLPAPGPMPETGAYNQKTIPLHQEVNPGFSSESAPERAVPQETQPGGVVQGSGPALPTPQVQSAAQQQVAPILNPVPVTNNNPISAADEDVIEKEWVDKAKKVVSQTKNDPYQQEKEVSRLQADYLKKRYGKEVKVSSD